MRLAWQWIRLEKELPDDWSEVRLVLTVGEKDAARAAGLLGGVNPLRRGDTIRLFVTRRGPGSEAEAIRRALVRLDRAHIEGKLELADVTGQEQAAPAGASAAASRKPLAPQWDEGTSGLPPDWSDLHAEVLLRSSDQLERGALLMAPVNPTRPGAALALQFRVARRFGYGVSPTMARRCFERLDAENIPGELRILSVLSDVDAVGTQGPVFRVGGRAV
jgi:hypothetical protein